MKESNKFLKQNSTWVFATYFTEGFPFTIVKTVFPIFFINFKTDLKYTTIFMLLTLPWSLKMLVAPIIDTYSNKKSWLITMHILTIFCILIASIFLKFNLSTNILIILFFFIATFSSAYDTATDGYYMEQLNEREQAKFIGLRIMAYKLAMMFVAGAIVTLGLKYNWHTAIFISSIIMIILLVYNILCLSRSVINKKYFEKNNIWDNYKNSILSFLNQKNIIAILCFIFFFRFNDWLVFNTNPLFLNDIGIYLHSGWLSTLIGSPVTILGALIGGIIIYEKGIYKMIWPIAIMQNFTNLLYIPLASQLSKYINDYSAYTDSTHVDPFYIVTISIVIALDQFASGLATALFMIILMKLCKKGFKATHYAFGTGLMALGILPVPYIGAFFISKLGYAWTYGLSFLISLPILLTVYFIQKNIINQPIENINDKLYL